MSKKYEVLLRDDSGYPIVERKAVIESDEPVEVLLQHAHILQVYGEVTETKEAKK